MSSLFSPGNRWILLLGIGGILLLSEQSVVIAQNVPPQKSEKADTKPAEPDYYPLKEGSVWNYEQKIGKLTFRPAARVTKVIKDRTGLVVTLEWTNKEAPFRTEILHILPEGLKRMRISPNEEGRIDPPLPILKTPLTAGDRWTWKGTHTVGGKSALIEADFSAVGLETVKTPAGTFKAMHIHLEEQELNNPEAGIKKAKASAGQSRMRLASSGQEQRRTGSWMVSLSDPVKAVSDYWYAPNVGLVMQQIVVGASRVEVNLISYKLK